jgi:hypothetical protein
MPQAMKAYGGVQIRFHVLVTLALGYMEVSGQHHVLPTLTPGKEVLIYEVWPVNIETIFYDETTMRFRVLPLGGDVEAILSNLREQVSTRSYSSVSCSRLLCEVPFCCRAGK